MSLCCQDNELARFLRYVSGSLLKSSTIGWDEVPDLLCFVDVTAQVGVVHMEFGLFRELLIQQW